MYSLVSAGVLACDLARHPSGAAGADGVARGRARAPAALAAPGPAAPEEVRARVLSACTGSPRAGAVLDRLPAAFADGLPSRRTSEAVLTALTETLVGSLEDLLGMLERELPGVPQAALDAVTVAWAGRVADLQDLARLRAPWAAGVPAVPAALPDTAYGESLRCLLEAVGRRTPQQWQRVVDAHGAHRGTFRWSTAMHRACQAAYDAGRLTDVARAQLAAARALRLSGASTGPDAHAVAMAVTGAVQAVCTADLAPCPDLMSAWEAGS